MTIVVICIFAVVGLLLASVWLHLSIVERDNWAITIYCGDSPLRLGPHPSIRHHPAIRARDVTDAPTRFVADPFMVQDGGRWYLFLEIFNEKSRRGEISLAMSSDALHWKYQQVVLREPFHLSYPQVFRWNDAYYMLPETRAASAVRLYRARRFPDQWEFAGEILSGPYADSTLVEHDGLWWLFAYQRDDSLSLFFARAPTGPWTPHPASPVVSADKATSRPGGRIVRHQGKLLRFAQDGTSSYGGALRAIQIDRMTTTDYAEHPLASGPVLGATGRGWNADGMHHADARALDDDSWIACVDGNQIRKVVNWRKGASRVRDKLRGNAS